MEPLREILEIVASRQLARSSYEVCCTSSILDLGWFLTSVCSDSLGNKSRGSWSCSPSKYPSYLILETMPISRVHNAPTRNCGGGSGKVQQFMLGSQIYLWEIQRCKIQAMHNTVMVGEKRVNRKRFVLPYLPVELSFPNEWEYVRNLRPRTIALPLIASWQRLTRLHFQYSQRIVNSGLWLHH